MKNPFCVLEEERPNGKPNEADSELSKRQPRNLLLAILRKTRNVVFLATCLGVLYGTVLILNLVWFFWGPPASYHFETAASLPQDIRKFVPEQSVDLSLERHDFRFVLKGHCPKDVFMRAAGNDAFSGPGLANKECQIPDFDGAAPWRFVSRPASEQDVWTPGFAWENGAVSSIYIAEHSCFYVYGSRK